MRTVRMPTARTAPPSAGRVRSVVAAARRQERPGGRSGSGGAPKQFSVPSRLLSSGPATQVSIVMVAAVMGKYE